MGVCTDRQGCLHSSALVLDSPTKRRAPHNVAGVVCPKYRCPRYRTAKKNYVDSRSANRMKKVEAVFFACSKY